MLLNADTVAESAFSLAVIQAYADTLLSPSLTYGSMRAMRNVFASLTDSDPSFCTRSERNVNSSVAVSWLSLTSVTESSAPYTNRLATLSIGRTFSTMDDSSTTGFAGVATAIAVAPLAAIVLFLLMTVCLLYPPPRFPIGPISDNQGGGASRCRDCERSQLGAD